MAIKNIHDYQIRKDSKIREAIKKIDEIGLGFVVVCDLNQEVLGIITDGDFRRSILKGVKLDEKVTYILNKNFIKLYVGYENKSVINAFLIKNIKVLPVLSNENKLTDILFSEDFNLENKIILPEKEQDIDVVIMAGGKGTRMAPFTNIFPKPLIPVGKKSMLEVIMDEYNKYGFNNFKISINYKGNLIKSYFDDLDHHYNISYLEENKFLGTAGALNLYRTSEKQPIFVSNCDILIKNNYLDILNYHNENNNDLTLVAAMVHFKVPYGICKIKEGGELIEISEKPEYDNLVNTGMYILSPSSLKLIPENEFFHITHLMKKIKEKGGKVGVYPVSEKSWIDVGQWKEYEKALNKFEI